MSTAERQRFRAEYIAWVVQGSKAQSLLSHICIMLGAIGVFGAFLAMIQGFSFISAIGLFAFGMLIGAFGVRGASIEERVWREANPFKFEP